MNRATIACLLILAGVAGCKKSELTEEDRVAKASAAAEAGTTAASTDAAAAGDAGAVGVAAAKSFGGKYTVSAGSMYVPENKDWASVKFKNDESKLLGEGELTIAVDGSGRVTGGSEGGPLGASVLDGTSDGTTLTATVRRKDPSDEGLTGTLQAKVAGDTIEGTMNLAESNAAVVRFARFQAKKK
jgi:hypothetical protein